MKQSINVFWFRRDLRLKDNAGLYHALKAGKPLLPIFIFDTNILDKLEDKQDARVTFIHQTLVELKQELEKLGSSLLIKYGAPEKIWSELLETYSIDAVFTNRDYEKYGLERDKLIENLVNQKGGTFHTFKDQVIFEKEEVVKKDGLPYTVFTPYSRKWKAKLLERVATVTDAINLSYYLKSYPNEKYFAHFYQTIPFLYPTLAQIGFEETTIDLPKQVVSRGLVRNYDKTRNFPAIAGTSKLGIHFRFGTISIREKARNAAQLNETFLNELIWRDFYAMILANFPHVANGAFRKKYENIPWRNNEREFKQWCEGKTGYPMVDAGMRELNATGFMHNRVRMVTSSFLTKHLLIDWRWGEAYFAQKLLDFDLASNNGGWQWAAGCGTDAAPYFRIFNPTSQMQKFDKELKYIKKWIPEYGTSAYISPIVNHKMARERCLATFKAALNNK
ncbi:MAG: deoxyribodipyrimidine photo-lyase [Saprospiraceae bacterium]